MNQAYVFVGRRVDFGHPSARRTALPRALTSRLNGFRARVMAATISVVALRGDGRVAGSVHQPPATRRAWALAVSLAASARRRALPLAVVAAAPPVDQRIGAATASLTAGRWRSRWRGVVALQAYRDAAKRPDLRLNISGCPQNSVVNISLVNVGSVSAQYAIVWLEYEGDVGVINAPNWAQEPGGLRWEAPAGLVIHPGAPAYTLPSIILRTPRPALQDHTPSPRTALRLSRES